MRSSASAVASSGGPSDLVQFTRIDGDASVMSPLDAAGMAIKQQAVDLHHPVNPLVIGRLQASGHAAAAPPSSVMNSRRLIGALPPGLGPHIITSLCKNAAVHHSKNCALMSQMGR